MPHKDEDKGATGGRTELTKLIWWFEASEDATDRARELSEKDRDYYLGIQWTSEEKQILVDRGEPCVTINRIRRKVDFNTGFQIQSRTRPRALPRTPADDDASEAATDGIRFVCDNNNYDRIRTKAREDIYVEGIGGIFVDVEVNNEEFEIILRRVAWDRFFFDPHSAADDFADARYMGEVIWMDADRAEERWPDKKDIVENSFNQEDTDDTYSDKPTSRVWTDPRRKRLRVVNIFYLKEGDWWVATFTRSGFFVDPKEVLFVDELGATQNPLIAQSLYVDRDNMRSGGVRDMVSPQDEVNKRRSKA